MKKNNANILHLQQLLIVIGVLVGFLSMSFGGQWSVAGEASEIERSSEEPVESAYQVAPLDAVTYSSQIQLNQEIWPVGELPEQEVEEEAQGEGFEFKEQTSKVFKILFRRIISTNAP